MNAASKFQNPSAPVDRAWLSRIDALRAEGNAGAALALVLPRLKRGIIDVETLDCGAMCFLDLGDGAAAVGLMELMTRTAPDLPAGWAKLAMMRETCGDQQGAIRDYRSALRLDPNLPSALHALDKLEPFTRQGAKARRVRKLSKSSKLAAADRALMFNTLGQMDRRAQRNAQAFASFSQSNALLGGTFNGAAIEALVNAQERIFQRMTPVGQPDDGPRVVFVCGMPRSGTTLVENILTRHSRVETIGESKALKSVLKAMRQHIAASGRGTGYWDWFGQLNADEIAAFRQRYLALALPGDPWSADVIVDKMPLNCLDMGAAHVLLPHARFVFLSRHPLDTALSNFATCFTDGNTFSRRLEWIGKLMGAVYRSLDDYRAKLDGQLWVQSYAALVQNPEVQIPALLEHLDLPWESACMSPEQQSGVVRTASVMQVREKINLSGLGKWQAFEDQLGPVVDALGGASWIKTWGQRDGLA